jgi:hypothetical protein
MQSQRGDGGQDCSPKGHQVRSEHFFTNEYCFLLTDTVIHDSGRKYWTARNACGGYIEDKEGGGGGGQTENTGLEVRVEDNAGGQEVKGWRSEDWRTGLEDRRTKLKHRPRVRSGGKDKRTTLEDGGGGMVEN